MSAGCGWAASTAATYCQGLARRGVGYGNLHIRYDRAVGTDTATEWVAYAHHVAWLLDGNPEPEPGYLLRRTRDERSCVNPQHLQPATRAENYRDFRHRTWDWHGPLNDPRGPLIRAHELKHALRALGAEDPRVLLAPIAEELHEQRADIEIARQAGHGRLGQQGTLLPGGATR